MTASGPITIPKVSATLLRGWLGVLQRRGILEALKPKLSSELAGIVAKPPLPIAWVEARIIDELISAAGQATDRETIRQCGFEDTRQRAGQMVMPMLRTLLKLWGATPATLFRNIGSVVNIHVRGTTMEYVPESETSGVMEVDPRREASDWLYAAWEGALMFVYEVAGVQGEVSRAELIDNGRKGKIRVRWKPN